MKMVNALLNGDASQVVSDLCIPLCPALPMPFSRGCPITDPTRAELRLLRIKGKIGIYLRRGTKNAARCMPSDDCDERGSWS